jgi:glutamyl-tRNA reductase
MRERFWISENRRYEALRLLSQAEGVEEVVVLATCNRTEFILWASEPSSAANSLLHFLSVEHNLKLTEWEHFYRLLDEAALTHIFRVTSGLDSLGLCESLIISQVQAAMTQARTVGACGHFLDSVLEKALSVAKQVQNETKVNALAVSIPMAAADLASQIFGSLEGRKVLLLGTGTMSELAARELLNAGAESVCVISQSPERAQALAEKLGGVTATLGDRWRCFVQADIVITCSGCPHVILTREEAERIAVERNRVALVIIDIGMPRDVDPEVRRVDGILLRDLDGLERVVNKNAAECATATAAAEEMVLAEAQAFHNKVQTESVVPTVVALRRRLDEICRQELEFFTEERGPFTREQDQALHAITAQVIQKIASSLARELKELPEKGEQERMTAAIQRLFHLESPKLALAGTRSKRGLPEKGGGRAAANAH